MLGALYWNPPIKAFTLPFINHDVVWYGILFAVGIFLSYFVMIRLITKVMLLTASVSEKEAKMDASRCVDKLSLYLVGCMVLFSRLFHLLFYEQWTLLAHDPLIVFRLWEGGLSSHGGVVGLFIGIILFLKREGSRYPFLSFVTLVDLLVIPSMVTGAFIRCGNFINQEILGVPTKAPWGVLFGASPTSLQGIALHPVVLYEAIIYIAAASFFMWLFLRWINDRGRIAGCFFILVFSARFLLEFLKQNQSYYAYAQPMINMGQWLSLPLIALGFWLFYQSFKPGHALLVRDIREQRSH